MLKSPCVCGTALFMACHVLADYARNFTVHVAVCLFSEEAYCYDLAR